MKQIMDSLKNCVDRAMKRGAGGAKITFHKSTQNGCEFENARLKTVGNSESMSYTIRVLIDGRIGATCGNNLDDLSEMLERAFTLARVGSKAHFDKYPAPLPVQSVCLYSDATAALANDKMIADCQAIADALKKHDPDLFINVAAGKSISREILVTSGGVSHEQEATAWSLGAYTQKTDGTDILFTGFSRGWRDPSEFYDPALIIERNIEDLRNSAKIAEPPDQEEPILLYPGTLAMLTGCVLLGINGRNVARNESPLAGRIGERILTPELSIIDKPHRDYSVGAASMDSDGIPTSQTPIFEHGTLKSFLYDLDSAGLAGATPTGHNSCRPYAPVVSPGKRSTQDIIASMSRGVYIKQLIGFGQSNVINGDFSANIGLGYRIRDGEIAGRVKNVMFSGNVYEVLGGGVEFSSDTDELLCMPHAVVTRARLNAAKEER